VVEIATSGVLEDADGQRAEILPCMVAGVDILAGRRTVLAYLMAPVVRTRDRALRK
jgi:adhesin transport system membrane fusion protein